MTEGGRPKQKRVRGGDGDRACGDGSGEGGGGDDDGKGVGDGGRAMAPGRREWVAAAGRWRRVGVR